MIYTNTVFNIIDFQVQRASNRFRVGGTSFFFHVYHFCGVYHFELFSRHHHGSIFNETGREIKKKQSQSDGTTQ